MKKHSTNLFLVIFLSYTITCSASVLPTIFSEIQDSKQLLLVLSPEWDSFQATVQRYERDGKDKAWYLIDKVPIPVVIGKNGLAWGIDWIKQSHLLSTDKVKKEGDGRSPAGIYSLGPSFGFAADAHKVIHTMQWIYLPLSATSICVDDQNSPYYNQLIDSAIEPNWDSTIHGEHMLQVPQYTWGNVINYNTHQVKGAGSCIFMHIWTDSAHGTAGCVAMSENEIIRILGWLDPVKKPLIALFPREIYKNIYKKWGFPL